MPTAPGRRWRPRLSTAWLAAVAIAGGLALVAGGLAVTHSKPHQSAAAGAWLAKAGELAAWAGAWAAQPQIVSATLAGRPVDYYRNPLRAVSGLVAQRIDDGADFSGSGPVYALGNGIVTSASGSNYGWPGGGWITYQLTSGPAAGMVVYVAEDITPAVVTGQQVSSGTVIGTMWAGGDGIETGWAQPTSLSAESELPQAGAIGGLGPFPTKVGVNFDQLLQTLGVPPAPNYTDHAYGILPAGYPASWR